MKEGREGRKKNSEGWTDEIEEGGEKSWIRRDKRGRDQGVGVDGRDQGVGVD